jgi:hypothetical protein
MGMRRLALIVTLLAAALPSAAAAAPTPVSTGLDECRTATATTRGSAIFRARMDAVDDTSRMGMRFDLQVRRPGDDAFRAVASEPNGWIRSAADVDQLIWHKRFEALAGPGDYRARVRFRWYDASGAVIAVAERRTVLCTQPDLRPDLELGGLTTQPAAQPGLARYSVPVRNAGRGDAGPFDVVLTLAGVPRPAYAVAGLRAGESQSAVFLAPPCQPGDQLRVELDPDDRIAEVDERDNALTVACP